jgi:hypothetical protein
MRNASPEPPRNQSVCAPCGTPILTAIEGHFYNPPVGSPRRFCSAACRQAAWRRQRAGIEKTAALQLRAGRTRRLPAPAPEHDHHRHHDHKPLLSHQEVITHTADHTKT